VRAGSHVVGRLATRTPVAEQPPSGPLAEDLGGAASFVGAVVPFDEVAIDLRHATKARKLAGPGCALQRAREYLRERQSAQALAEAPRILLAALRQRDVGQTGVLTGQAPRSFAMAGQIDGGQRFAHWRTFVGRAQTDVEGGAARGFAKLYD